MQQFNLNNHPADLQYQMGGEGKNNNRRNVPLPSSNDPKPGRNLVLFLFLALVMAFFLFFLNDGGTKVKKIPYSLFIKNVISGDYNKQQGNRIKIVDKQIQILKKSGEKGFRVTERSFVPYFDPELMPLLKKNDVEISGEEKSDNSLLAVILNLLPWIILIGFIWFLMMRQIQGSGNKAMSFGKSRARLFQADGKKITFKDVAGVEEAKVELQEVIDFLVNPGKFRELGARIPKGVLLVGPPGTGKTLLARAVAGEAKVPFLSISGSDFVEMFVGVGASRVRDLFEQGKRKAPCILFIDELDAVGRSRGAGYGGGHDEREQTLNQMLVEMDGFEANEGLIIVAATNRPDVLDPALLRPGRFDRQVVVDSPDVKGREAILQVHTKELPVASDVDLEVIARGTPGFTGADLANMVNEAALLAARRNKKKIFLEDIDDAKDKVLMGPERRSLVINEHERFITAYHEAGHALLGFVLPDSDPVHKITIIPRGRALGLTQSLPIDERRTYSRNYLLDQIVLLMGGRTAEEMIHPGNVTNGASNDIERATQIARAMVCEWGMSEAMGPLVYGQKEQPIFIGKEIARHKDYSDKVAELIDGEIRAIIDTCHKLAGDLLKKHKKAVEALAEALLKDETVDAPRLEQLMNKNKVKKMDRKERDKMITKKKSSRTTTKKSTKKSR